MNSTGLRRVGKTSQGFTIVELLIVVVVIAILAAITIVAYNGVNQRAAESAVLSEGSQVSKKIQSNAILNNEIPPESLDVIGVSNTDNTTYQYSRSGTNGFCLTIVKGNKSSFVANNYSHSGGTIVNQQTPALGSCPGHSPTGGTVVRNLTPNPSAEVDTFGWTQTNTTLTSSTTWASSGSRSFRVVNTGTTNSGDFRVAGSSLSVIPGELEAGKTYTISARVYMPAAPTGGFGRSPGVLVWISTNASTWVENFGPKAPAAAGTYTVSHTVSIPSNATGVIIGFGAASSTASQSFYYDSIMVTEGTTQYAYGDGNSPNWIWTGAPHQSSSTGPAL